jgi:hypothetical protein
MIVLVHLTCEKTASYMFGLHTMHAIMSLVSREEHH